MRQRGQSPQPRRASQGDVSSLIAESRSRALAARPATAWQPLSSTPASSASGNFAVHGQSVRQVQVRTPSFSSTTQALKHQQSISSSVSKQASDNNGKGRSPDGCNASQRYLGVLRAMPRSSSMPRQSSRQATQGPLQRSSSRAASRGRQERPVMEAPQPGPAPRAELNGLVFKQSLRGDALIVSRTLAARLAAPHSLHLDNLRLKECCTVEGEELVTTLSYQHNSISSICRLEQLPQLIILDMYGNNIHRLQGLPKAPALRGLMLGRNYITVLDDLQALRTLEVLDLQSNLIEVPLGLTVLTGLRRLNLAGNRIHTLCSLTMLTSLEDLSLSRNFIASLEQRETEAGSSEASNDTPLLPSNLRKLALSSNRLARLDDLKPLQQLTSLKHLELDGNPCCSLHPPARFRIEVLARQCSQLQQMDFQQITHAERSLAAAMRWQEELTSRAGPSLQPKASAALALAHIAKPSMLSSARLEGQLSIPQPARASSLVMAPRSPTPIPRAEVPVTGHPEPQPAAVHVKQISSRDHAAVDEEAEAEQHSSASGRDAVQAMLGTEGTNAGQAPEGAASNEAALVLEAHLTSSAAAGHAVLARLPSAKGHHLVSYSGSIAGRPASPMKNPATPGDIPRGDVHSMLSVRTLSMQHPRLASPDPFAQKGAILGETQVAQDAAVSVILTSSSKPEQQSVPPPQPEGSHQQEAALGSTTHPALGETAASMHARPHTTGHPGRSLATAVGSMPAASPSDGGSLPNSYSGRAAWASSTNLPPGLFQQAREAPQRSASFTHGMQLQHAIPERLLTASQASALLSGMPPGTFPARHRQQSATHPHTDSSLYTDADALADTPALQCIGRSQQQPPRGAPLAGSDPTAEPPKPVPVQQQKPPRSAELIDGCCLHINGDAMDAVQSPVCQSVKEVTLTQVPWSSVAAGLPSLAALPHLRQLSLLDNNLQHLHQIDGIAVLTALEELTLKHNPLAKQVLMQPYIACCLPDLRVFNGCVITTAERATAKKMFQPLQAARTAASNNPVVSLAMGLLHGQSATEAQRLASAHRKSGSGDQDNLQYPKALNNTVQSVWSSLVNKLVQQDLRAKKFDELWPGILDSLIIKGFAGAY